MKGLVLLLFILFTSTSFASRDDTMVVVQDTLHSVKNAVILSAVVPGAGQIYNHIAMPKGKKESLLESSIDLWSFRRIDVLLDLQPNRTKKLQRRIHTSTRQYYQSKLRPVYRCWNPEFVQPALGLEGSFYTRSCSCVLHSNYRCWS